MNAQQRGGLGGGMLGAVGGVPLSDLIVLRPIPGRRQLAIRVDLTQAYNDPRTRLYVRSGDTSILRYKAEEELINFGLATFFTFGIRELFSN